jgi:hypothetical protein
MSARNRSVIITDPATYRKFLVEFQAAMTSGRRRIGGTSASAWIPRARIRETSA